MELLLLILIGGLFALWVSNRDLKRRLDMLEQRLDHAAFEASPVAAEPWAPAQAPPLPTPEVPFTVAHTRVPEPERAAAGEPPEPAPVEPPQPVPHTEAAPERETMGALFERFVAGKMLIWLGGIAIVVAAVFLIRYSIEVGLVTPQLRMIAAAMLGLVLLGVGEYARVGRFADDPRIAQVLVGAGLVVLYLTTFGSYALYALINGPTASGLMIAVTAAALGLSLRHGAPTAVMGLTGGFLTPLLVGDPDAGAVPLVAYLGLLDLALFLIAWRRGWTWLAAAAVVLSFVWSGYLLAQPPDDALAAGAFVILLALAASLVRPGEGRELGLVQPLAVGIVQLAILVARTDLGLPAWGLFAVLAIASLGLAALRREYWLAPLVAVVLALVLLLTKAGSGQDPHVPIAAVGITIIFGLGGLALVLVRPQQYWTSVGCAGFAAPALIARALRPELLDRPVWGALLLALAAGPAALVWINRRQAEPEPPGDIDLFVAAAAAALLAGAAVWDLLPTDFIAAGWLVVAIALALTARRLGDLAVATISTLVAAIAISRAVFMVPQLSTAAITAVVGVPVLARDLPSALAALWSLALPAALIVGLRLAMPPLPLGARRILPVVAGIFAVAAVYVWFKQAFGLADDQDFVTRGLLERTIITQFLFVSGWLLGAEIVRLPRVEGDMARIAGTALTAFAAARLIWFDMIVHDPAFADQWVGTIPVANLILPEYLLGALWLYLARRRADQATRSGFWLAAFFAALVAGTMLLVRQGFHGPILTGPEMPTAEYYTYSLAGLILSIGLLAAGIRLPDKALRLAGLILLTATIVKVFLLDAGALEGIWRILSFLGLGVALIGIGRIYGPVLRAEAGAGAAAAEPA